MTTQEHIQEKADILIHHVHGVDYADDIIYVMKFLSDFRNEVLEEAAVFTREDEFFWDVAEHFVTRIRSLKSSTTEGENNAI